jgi:ribosomal-protein-alanine N-acetyltransferase
MTLTLRYMQATDVSAVVDIDRQSFTPSWSTGTFHFEINQSLVSHMAVLEHRTPRPAVGLRHWLNTLRGQQDALVDSAEILAFGGLWRIEDEAHISTIASHPEQRGKKYGEIVLAGMVRRSLTLRAQYIVLEVRVSNVVAQNLYLKYGFEIVDVRKNYYQHNREDAYDMRLHFDKPGVTERVEELYAALQAQMPFTDTYSATPHPRLGV